MSDPMDDPIDRYVLLLAQGRGMVSDEAVARAREAVAAASLGEPSAGRILAWLAEQRHLTPAQLAALVAEASQEAPTFGRFAGEAPAETLGEPIPDVPRDWRRYTDIHVIGEGGMGTVYRAFDPRLRRRVALKFLHAGNRQTVEACLREARAQARVEHPNVCQIYEVGEAGQRLYISMQFIEGQTWRALANALTPREHAEIAAQVARALHAAHLQGLVHRGVKPSNIMVECTVDGRWRPYVLDFGLARDLSQATGATVSGTVLGTPAYMAPEQARGEVQAIDPRTDVYSLGATLYDLLTGCPPFDGTVAEVLLKVLQEDAPPVRQRRPSLPADLAAIVDRCLEKDPSRRYPNALELALDLERFVAGEAVTARARSRWYVWARRLHKHRLAVAAGAIALLAVVGGGVVTVTSVLAVRRQAELAQTFARELGNLEESVRLIYSRPLHDIRPELARIRERLDWIASEAAKAGRIGAGPGNHALGRGYMALGEYARAEEHLRRAWEHGFRPPELAYDLSLALVARYREALAAAPRLRDPDLEAAQRRQLDEKYRQPALAFLAQAQGAHLQAQDYAGAQIAFLAENYAEALAKARAARQRIPWLYQASLLEGEVHLERAAAALQSGDLQKSAEALEEGRQAFRAAVGQAPSDPAGYVGLCAAANLAFLLELERGEAPHHSRREALDTCGQALTADPTGHPALRALARAHLQWSDYQLRRGIDPGETLAAATQLTEELVHLDPSDSRHWTQLGIIARLEADLAIARGGDPRPRLELARQHLRRALHLDPTSFSAANNLALAHLSVGLDASARGLDPRPALGEAVEVFTDLLTRHPKLVAALDNLSVALWAMARWEYAHGGEGDPLLDRAQEVLTQSLHLNPNDTIALNNLGVVAGERAAFLVSQDRDPSAALAAGREALARAVTLSPEDPYAVTNLGQLWRLAAEWEERQGRSPHAALGEAHRALARALTINPADAEAATAQALCYLVEARWAVARRASPARPLQRAEAALHQALTHNPAYPEAKNALAHLHRQRAEWLTDQPESALAQLEAGRRALADLPPSPETSAHLGELELTRARLSRGAARQAAAQRAVEAFRAALAGNRWLAPRLTPLLAEAHRLAPAAPGAS